jgi:hypothetical protein
LPSPDRTEALGVGVADEQGDAHRLRRVRLAHARHVAAIVRDVHVVAAETGAGVEQRIAHRGKRPGAAHRDAPAGERAAAGAPVVDIGDEGGVARPQLGGEGPRSLGVPARDRHANAAPCQLAGNLHAECPVAAEDDGARRRPG